MVANDRSLGLPDIKYANRWGVYCEGKRLFTYNNEFAASCHKNRLSTAKPFNKYTVKQVSWLKEDG